MSDRMMSVAEARAVLELDSAPLPMRQAARTIVAQAERTERLREALRGTLPCKAGGRMSVETYYDLLPGDMGPRVNNGLDTQESMMYNETNTDREEKK